MSDIDWQRLTDEHDQAPETDTADWLTALASFDEDPDERKRALDAEPLLLFRALPGEEVGTADIEAMKQAVASMRAAKDSLQRADGVELAASNERSRRRWAVAALFALAVSVAGLTGVSVNNTDSLAAWEQASLELWTEPLPIEIAQLPLVEDVGPEIGPLMQIEDDGVSLVVVMGGGGSDLPMDNGDA